MPFREKMKRALGRSDSQSDSLSLEKTVSSTKSNVYKPGEPMPPPKYRGRVDPSHKATLEKFNFSFSEWRRKSTVSLYSPMGSKLPSRNNSVQQSYLNNMTSTKAEKDLKRAQGSVDYSTESSNGTRSESSESPASSDTDGVKSNMEHVEYADKSSTPSDGPHQPMTDADVTNALEKLRSRMVTKPE